MKIDFYVSSKDETIVWNKIGGSLSNQNMNEGSLGQKDNSSINRHITILSIRSSHCQTDIPANVSQTTNIDLNPSETTVDLREQLTDTLYRRLREPLMFTNRDVLFRHDRTLFLPTISSGTLKLFVELTKT